MQERRRFSQNEITIAAEQAGISQERIGQIMARLDESRKKIPQEEIDLREAAVAKVAENFPDVPVDEIRGVQDEITTAADEVCDAILEGRKVEDVPIIKLLLKARENPAGVFSCTLDATAKAYQGFMETACQQRGITVSSLADEEFKCFRPRKTYSLLGTEQSLRAAILTNMAPEPLAVGVQINNFQRQ